jgi:glycosyltransferase involved in cell wall biosynthesis
MIGSRMRSFNILGLLGRRNQVTVALAHAGVNEVSLFREDPLCMPGSRVVKAARCSEWANLRGAVFERYRPIFTSQTRGIYRDGLRSIIEREEPDVVWFFRFDTVWKTGCVRYDVPVICDVDDFEAKAYRRAIRLLSPLRRSAALLDFPSVVRAQRAAAGACDLLLVANHEDVQEAAEMTGRPVRVAPNGYDYSVPPAFRPPQGRRIVFFGALNYLPNIDGLSWFVRDIWPKIREAVPDVRLEVAGAPGPDVEFVGQEPGVRLCGFVESIRSFVEGAALLVVPLRMGGGTRIKILEAWALGLPVVSTTIGCEGLDAVDGENIVVADEPKDFAEACVKLLGSPGLGVDLARHAFDLARSRNDWQALEPLLVEALKIATNRQSDEAGRPGA